MNFLDRKVQFPSRIKLIKIKDESDGAVYDIQRAEGQTVIEGTLLNASTFNQFNQEITEKTEGLKLPIGSLYLNATNGQNPKILLGYGEWSPIGQGRVLIGEGTSDQTFIAGTIGGTSTVKLNSNEIPAHTHSILYGSGGQSYNVTRVATASVGGGQPSNSLGIDNNSTPNNPHNNLPPYLVVYIWIRTA